jgi:hypothetical protein
MTQTQQEWSKPAMCAALRAFINQRSGIEWGNYSCGDYKQSREAFMGDYRPMLRADKHARIMLALVEECDGITAKDLLEATRAYSGRLQFVQREDKVGVDYTTGQYFPTEYRNAACAVLASALWAYWRDGRETGEEIRKCALQRLGRAIARDWFN